MNDITGAGEASQKKNEVTQPKAGRGPLIAILVISVLPIALAYFIFFTGLGVPENTVNHGHLIQDAPDVRPLVAESEWQRIEKDKKWRLLLPVDAQCASDDICTNNLYVTRQVYLRLGEKSQRLERLALSIDGEASDNYLAGLKEEHPFLKVAATNRDAWNAFHQSLALQFGDLVEESYYILVDQEGKAVLLYDNAIHGNDLITDIKRALKYSIDFQ